MAREIKKEVFPTNPLNFMFFPAVAGFIAMGVMMDSIIKQSKEKPEDNSKA